MTVELKNDLSITGVLHSVDQYLNIKLNNIKVAHPEKYPHMLSVRNCFVRGSVVRYIQVRALFFLLQKLIENDQSENFQNSDPILLFFLQLPPGSVDVELLHDATRREARGG